MTKIHQCREINFSALIPCFFDHLFLVSDIRQLPCRTFLKFFPLFYHCCLCHSEFSLHDASEWICEQDCNDSENSSIFQRCDLGDVCVLLLLALVSCFRRHQHLRFPILRWGLPTDLYRYFARHCCWHRNFQLSTSGSDCELEFFIVWLAFFLAASDINFHFAVHTSSGREVFRFFVSLPPDHIYPSGGLSFCRTNLVKPVQASDSSFSPSTFQ